ncbi:hypothetical protein [Citrobacter sp. Res13-Sevr-PEB04-36]|uniref:hypothetical protein n=1 Tax=Citrobacter sp. Res13-Sevr-PEB04-36 TaxID=2777960 RepID=UPI0018ACC6F8|nr:hypothetical protein [Citrobacter sp. Res13-Sevr-PEB04-36]
MNTNNKFDLWLVRISYIAQVGLFFLTTFTIFYTVIPIYQNANLQESIAKKELEYEKLKEKQRILYLNLRREYSRKYVIDAISQCSPTEILMRQPSEDDIRKPHNVIMNEFKKHLDKDLSGCFEKVFYENHYVKELNDNDQQDILHKIKSLTPSITKLHEKYEANFKDNNSLLNAGKESSTSLKKTEEFLISTGNYSDGNKKDFENSYVESGAYDLVVKYGFEINNLFSNTIKYN